MLTIHNDVTKVKEINEELVKSALKSMENATKALISEKTGLSVATCGKILNELCETGEVEEVSIITGGYGRPAKTYSYNASFSYIACMYVISDRNQIFISTMVGNLIGEKVEEETTEIDKVDYSLIEETIARLISKYDKIRVVAIGIPGYLTNGTIALCNFLDLTGLPLCAMLEEKFPALKFCVENDMNASAYGFYNTCCQERDTIIGFLYAPFGVLTGLPQGKHLNMEDEKRISRGVKMGAGFVASGRILRGFSGFAGEVAFLPAIHANQWNDSVLSVEVMTDVIGSIVPILNPEMIALTGNFFTEEICEQIRRRYSQDIEAQHMPEIIYRNDVHTDYMNGLIDLALEQLSCDVVLVKKNN